MTAPTPETARRMLVLAREDARLSQAQLAKRAGTSQPAVAAIEVGTRGASPELLARLFDAVGLRPSVALAVCADDLIALATAHGLQDVRVIGSAARGDDSRDSDADLLAGYEPGSDVDVVRMLAFAPRASALLGIPVDLVLEPVGGGRPGRGDGPGGRRGPGDERAPRPAVTGEASGGEATGLEESSAEESGAEESSAEEVGVEVTGSSVSAPHGPAVPLAGFTPRPRADRIRPPAALDQLAVLHPLLARLDDVTLEQIARPDGAVALRVEATLARLADAVGRLPAATRAEHSDLAAGLASARAVVRSGLDPALSMRLLEALPAVVTALESALRATPPASGVPGQ